MIPASKQLSAFIASFHCPQTAWLLADIFHKEKLVDSGKFVKWWYIINDTVLQVMFQVSRMTLKSECLFMLATPLFTNSLEGPGTMLTVYVPSTEFRFLPLLQFLPRHWRHWYILFAPLEEVCGTEIWESQSATSTWVHHIKMYTVSAETRTAQWVTSHNI